MQGFARELSYSNVQPWSHEKSGDRGDAKEQGDRNGQGQDQLPDQRHY